MKKVLLAVVLALFASVAQAQVTITPPSTSTAAVDANWTRSGIDLSPTNVGDTMHLDGLLTLNSGLKTSGSIVHGSGVTDFWGLTYTDWVDYSDWVLEFAKSGTKNSALTVVGTLPIGENATIYGANFYVGAPALHVTGFAGLVANDAYAEYGGGGAMSAYMIGTRGTAAWGATAASAGYVSAVSADVATSTGASSIAAIYGEKVTVGTVAATTATAAYGLDISFSLVGTSTNAYGINIGNVSGATNNYAIKTGTGTVQFGDTTIFGRGATAQGVVWFLEDSDNGSNKVIVQPAASLAADYTVTLPAATGTLLLQAFGDLYIDSDAGTAFAVDATAGTYEQFTSWTTGTASSNVTLSATSDDITVTVAGTYAIDFNIAFTGGNNDEYRFLLYKEGVAVTACKFVRTMGSAAAAGAAGFSCAVAASANDSFDVRATNVSDGDDITVYYANLRVTRIGS